MTKQTTVPEETFEAYQSRRLRELSYETGALGMQLQITLAALLRSNPAVGLEIMRTHGITADTVMVRNAEAQARQWVS